MYAHVKTLGLPTDDLSWLVGNHGDEWGNIPTLENHVALGSFFVKNQSLDNCRGLYVIPYLLNYTI